MIDTARLKAAARTFGEFCEQLRLILVAKGYPDGHANVEVMDRGSRERLNVWVFDSYAAGCTCKLEA